MYQIIDKPVERIIDKVQTLDTDVSALVPGDWVTIEKDATTAISKVKQDGGGLAEIVDLTAVTTPVIAFAVHDEGARQDIARGGFITVYRGPYHVRTDKWTGNPSVNDLMSVDASGDFITATAGDQVVGMCYQDANLDGQIEVLVFDNMNIIAP